MNFLKTKNIFYLLSDDNNCVLQTTFDKSIQFDEPMECALHELILPNILYRNNVLTDLKITGTFNWVSTDPDISNEKEISKKFSLKSIFDLPSSVENIVRDINQWIKSIIYEEYNTNHKTDIMQSLFTSDQFENFVLNDTSASNTYFTPFNFQSIGKKISLRKSGKFDFLSNILGQSDSNISRNKRQVDNNQQSAEQSVEQPAEQPAEQSAKQSAEKTTNQGVVESQSLTLPEIELEKLPVPQFQILTKMALGYALKTFARYVLKFNDKLSNLLGLKEINIDNVEEVYINPIQEFEDRNINYLFVYCDEVVNSYMNDRRTNLLRVIPIRRAEKSEMTIYKFEKPLFVPLRVNEINSLRISLKDEENNDLFYTKGKLLAKLILRPIREY